MKNLILLVVAVAVGVVAWPTVSERFSPAKGIEKVADELPRAVTGKYPKRIGDVSYDVRKTDSLVTPVIGCVNFTETYTVPAGPYNSSFDSSLKMQLLFKRSDGKWFFSKLINRENGLDFTEIGGGLELLTTPEMSAFLSRYGWEAPPPAPVVHDVAGNLLPRAAAGLGDGSSLNRRGYNQH